MNVHLAESKSLISVAIMHFGIQALGKVCNDATILYSNNYSNYIIMHLSAMKEQ